MNNASASKCGSGCESGWTFYLDQSWCHEDDGGNGARFMVEAEEDLSMVSDASSGPRQYYCADEDGSFCSAPPAAPQPATKGSKNKKKIKQHVSNQHHSCLDDDTASSPKNCSKEASVDLLDFSQGFSGTYFKGKSAFHKKLGFLKSGKAGSEDAEAAADVATGENCRFSPISLHDIT
ncbi:hypothetical protein V6N11_034430 [Hibiscus sabdariffa]|uniref:Uncharacterized protein n=2 Tax=Hibiscus sabdariffa TaxID=183260 RepID=A0ABR2NMH1_9ROSI